MIKLFVAGILLADNILLWFILQVVPGSPAIRSSLEAYLISAIAALVASVSALFFYSKSLNKLLKTASDNHAKDIQDLTSKHLDQLRQIYTEHIGDYKETTNKNTEAFTLNANASREVAESTKENTRALTDLRLWLSDKIKTQL